MWLTSCSLIIVGMTLTFHGSPRNTFLGDFHLLDVRTNHAMNFTHVGLSPTYTSSPSGPSSGLKVSFTRSSTARQSLIYSSRMLQETNEWLTGHQGCPSAWSDAKKIRYPASVRRVSSNNLVVERGMGSIQMIMKVLFAIYICKYY